MTKKDEPKSTALAVVQHGAIAVLESDETAGTFPELFRDSGLTLFDLERVTVPGSGGAFFTVQGPTGERPTADIEGVIAVEQARQRAYYHVAFGDGDPGPPDCASTDGVNGIGVRHLPGDAPEPSAHDCMTCSHNAFGTIVRADGAQGRGKACREFMRLVIFGRDDLVPMVLNVPPTSLKPMKDYLLRLVRHSRELGARGVLRAHLVVTRLALKTETKSGFKTSILDPRPVELLDGENAARMARLHDELGALLRPALESATRSGAMQPPRDVEIEDEPEEPASGSERISVSDDAPSSSEIGEVAEEVEARADGAAAINTGADGGYGVGDPT